VLVALLSCTDWSDDLVDRADIVVDNCAICRNHIMDLCEYFRVCILCGPPRVCTCSTTFIVMF
jgi:hypothetical protein